jgi:hypothetical protein
MEQKIPSKPDFLSKDAYDFIITRDHRRCVLRDQCLASGKLDTSEFCSSTLDLDHHHPKSLGGDGSIANMRLLCQHENRSRPENPSAYWEKLNYWDGEFNWLKLRDIQALASYDAVLDKSIEGFPSRFRDTLLSTVTLKIGATGIGKTFEMISTLFAINQSVRTVGAGRPRVRQILWLTTDQTLRDLTKQELEDDIYALGMVQTRPCVRVANSFTDLLKADGADVTVSCAHSLWRVGDNEPRRSTQELYNALQHFDTLVFDEVDVASEQVQHIVDHAGHALKFSLTASPPIMEGVGKKIQEKCMSRFVIIDSSAVADYQRAIKLDGCLKRLSPNDDPHLVTTEDLIVPCASHDAHEVLSRGGRVTTNKEAEPDHVSYLAAIMTAVYQADELEQAMRKECPNDWYSPHIMVRMDSIAEIRVMLKALPSMLDQALATGRLKGDGWGVTGVFQGCERDMPADEHDLSAKRRGKHRHPFMRAKDNRGQATAKLGCKRILLMCQIGIRGINNWPILFLVDNTATVSIQQLIQIIGRAIRWPNHLVSWHGNLNLQRFLAVKLYIPQCLLTEEKKASLDRALKFIVNMEQEVADAQFRTWHDLQENNIIASVAPTFDSDTQPLTYTDELKIIDAIGGLLPSSSISTALVASVVGTMGEMFGGAKSEHSKKLTQNLLENSAFRKAKLGSYLKTVDPIARLKPKDHYESEDLIRFVKQSSAYETDRAAYIQAIEQAETLVIKLLAKALHAEQSAQYREPSRRWQLQTENGEKGLLSELANEIRIEIGAFLRDPAMVYAATNTAASRVFGISSAKNNGPMNEHPYHVAIIGRYRQEIKNQSQNLLGEWGAWPNRQKLIEIE